ncbi:MAG: SUMF1/EgtB/PvdO family nonheme iron enzyme [Bacteroidales bacterium]|nr:SUMF1/EgtB/PvdO family nonheme iron enzyme [Bacteroidales bacterium]
MNRLTILTALICLSLSVQAQPKMVRVEGGSYSMGNPGTSIPKGDQDERPVHEVKINTFYIGQYEVTVGEYKQFANDPSGSKYFPGKRMHQMPSAPDSLWYSYHPDMKKYFPLPTMKWWGWHDAHPIQRISWYDAVAYCNWLSDKEGLEKVYFENEDGGIEFDLNKNGYRLPTEAEWEYAARGGQKSKNTLYAGSSDPAAVAWFDETSKMLGPQNVGSKAPNELGIYDMCGNVWEWCSDYYAKDFYSKSKKDNPVNTSISLWRVVRGGGWHYTSDYATLTSRDGPEASFAEFYHGMRIARNAQ